MKTKHILLASHGTAGGAAAESLALEICRENAGRLHQLIVVPDFWKDMMGDDWLNNAVTQIRFGNYVENQLQREIAEHVELTAAKAKDAGIPYSNVLKLGKPADCLIEENNAASFDLAVIGSPRPKGTPGLRSRMNLETLVRGLNIPLLIVPYPGK
ncbi:MAG: universal stress protein [Rhodospirillales bacterium]|nr:universal stress protein [Rhodospirillales bacterium]